MIDETDLSQEQQWFYEERAKTAVAAFLKRNIDAIHVPDRQTALDAVLAMVPPGASVVRGDSVTLDQIGVVDGIRQRGQNQVLDPLERKEDGSFVIPHEKQKDAARQAFMADVYLTGVNAVTLDGKLVSTDGRGNRVAPLIYGPDKVIVVAGANKIVKNLEEAFERIRTVAAPMNARRHFLKHEAQNFGNLPCVRTGRCADCAQDWRICRYTVIVEGAMLWEKNRISVVLVAEELGI